MDKFNIPYRPIKSDAQIEKLKKETSNRWKDPDFKNRVSQKISEAYSSEEMKAVQASKFIKHNEESKEKIRNANLGKQRKGEDWVSKMAEKKKGNQAHAKPFKTPSGAFPSKKIAVDWAIANGVRNPAGKFDKWIKEKSDEFYYISEEEYTKIKDDPKILDLPWMKNSTRLTKYRI